MLRAGIIWLILWTPLALVLSGCKGVDLSSVPLADELGFAEVQPVPKEIKNHEYRVGLPPAGVVELVKYGHEVLVEMGAGDGAGFDDQAYSAAGAGQRPKL